MLTGGMSHFALSTLSAMSILALVIGIRDDNLLLMFVAMMGIGIVQSAHLRTRP